MHDSDDGSVSQGLVDRIGKLLEESGAKLPECWKGEWREGNAAGRSTGKFTFTVTPEGDVEGAGTGRQVVTAGGSTTYQVDVAGRRQDDTFRLLFSGPGGALDVVVPIDGTRARGPWRTGAGQAAYGGVIMLECARCPPRPGG